MDWLVDPIAQYEFFQRALVAGTVVGAMCGAIGVFVVLRRMSYIGHGLSHSVLGGVAVGLALGTGLYWGAAVATLLSALLIHRISRRRGLHADAAIAIVTTAMFALGFAVISVTRNQQVNIESLLFGNILGIDDGDLLLAVAVAAAFAVTLFVCYKPLLFVTFDPTVASVSGVRTGIVEAVFNLMTAAVIIVSIRVLGVTLIAAAVVVPAALARLLTQSFGRMLALSVTAGVTMSLVGLYASYYVNVPSGATIVLTGAALFGLIAAGTALGVRGQVRRARRALSTH